MFPVLKLGYLVVPVLFASGKFLLVLLLYNLDLFLDLLSNHFRNICMDMHISRVFTSRNCRRVFMFSDGYRFAGIDTTGMGAGWTLLTLAESVPLARVLGYLYCDPSHM